MPQQSPVIDALGYHRLSAYEPGRHWRTPLDDPRVRTDFVAGQPAQVPDRFKVYPVGLPRLALPVPQAAGPAPATTLAGLSRLLDAALGVRTGSGGPARQYRAASSAGNRHPVEAYLCAVGVAGVPDGVWHYGPRRHTLTRVGPAPAGGRPGMVLTGVPWRTCWRYAERGYRHLWWDAGTVTAHLLAVLDLTGPDLTGPDPAGGPGSVWVGFDDAQVARLVGARPPGELPLAVVAFGDALPAWDPGEPSSPAVAGELGAGVELPLVDAVHRAGTLAGPEVARWRRARPPAALPERGLAAGIAGRGSTRRFDRRAGVSLDELLRVVRAGTAAVAWDAGHLPTELHVVAHAVAGLPPGLYRCGGDALYRVRADVGRERSRAVGLGQALAGDCAALLVFSTDLGKVVAVRGQRGYRAAQLAAGIALGRCYLSAHRAGLGCTGLTFDDVRLGELVPAAPDGLVLAAIGR